MKLFNVLLSGASLALLLSVSSLSAATNCNNSHRVVSVEKSLSILRGTIQLDRVRIDSTGDVTNSEASIVRGRKFSVHKAAGLPGDKFLAKFGDNITFPTNLNDPVTFTRYYEALYKVEFNCEYDEPPTVLLTSEYTGITTSGDPSLTDHWAFLESSEASVRNVTKKFFVARVLIPILTEIPHATSYPESEKADNIVKDFSSNLRLNFEVIGRRS